MSETALPSRGEGDPSPAPSAGEGPAPVPDPGAFEAYVARWREAIDGALLGGVLAERDPDLRRYLYRPTVDFLARGGKRIRPALVVMACEACGGTPEAALPAAAAVEHFQSAALIHDDIADEAETRRGLPAVHVSEGVGLAINLGDLALVESFRGVLETPGLPVGVRNRILAELAQMMVRTVEGQALDVGWARDGRWDLTADDYLRMATLKTAHYSVATPLVMGAVVAGAPEDVVEVLRQMGLAAGLAFQIADDLLDLTGSVETLGKQPLGDLTEGKRTLAVVGALGRLDEGERRELEGLLAAHVTDPSSLERARELVERGGGIAEARAVARSWADRAQRLVERLIFADSPAARALAALPYYVVGRTS